MESELPVTFPNDAVGAFARRWSIRELALFGSVLTEAFRPDSDVDVLVTFDPDARHGLLALARMHRELAEIVGREVDLIPRDAVLESSNRGRRERILNSARTVYAA